MLEELRENVLALLEQRVERAINLIHRLRKDKLELESEISQLRDESDQQGAKIQELQKQNAELEHVASELRGIVEKHEQERQEVDREKAEIRDRLEGLMTMLNGVDDKGEKQASTSPTPAEEPSKAEEASEPDRSASSAPANTIATEQTPSTTP